MGPRTGEGIRDLIAAALEHQPDACLRGMLAHLVPEATFAGATPALHPDARDHAGHSDPVRAARVEASVPAPEGARSRKDGVAAALGLGLRMMLQRPKLAAALLVTTVAQGALQGLLLLALRQVLIGFSRDGHVSAGRLMLSATVIFGIWLLRAASSSGGDVLAAKLADTVEIAAIRKVLAKLLTLSVRFFDKNSREDIVLASYHDLKSIRNVTLAIGDMVQYASRLLGLIVVAWMMSPELAAIGLVLGPLGRCRRTGSARG